MSVPVVLAISVFGVATPLAYAVSYYTHEPLLCLTRDDNNKLKAPLAYWLCLSAIHAVLVLLVGFVGEELGIIVLVAVAEPAPRYLLTCLCYWVLFEMMYFVAHAAQHRVTPMGFITRHKAAYPDGHHGLTGEIGPDYLTAFTASPLDSFLVQVCAQSPWLFRLLLPPHLRPDMSYFAYGSVVALMAYSGIRSHCQYSFSNGHWQHHQDPKQPCYTFSGWPDEWLNIIWRLAHGRRSPRPIPIDRKPLPATHSQT